MNLYDEPYRPQFHFTAQKNWLNDPNGLVYYKGEYHLFFQHNPESAKWGNMTWGHAVSPDMLHWKQLPHAIEPDELGTIFSGSAAVDWNNTAGFQTGDEKVIVNCYTSAGSHAPEPKPFTQSIAYSNDRGRTYAKCEGNPVLGHIVGSNRDPRILWHKASGQWIMALYLDKNDYGLFGSPNLKEWTHLSSLELPRASECPDFFELPLDGDPENARWVFWGGNGRYLIGTFDGREFETESETQRSEWGKNCYAAQTWSDVPESDGRTLQIGWMAGGSYPDMPFNQQMSFPCRLSLRSHPEGIRLCREPVREIESIHGERHALPCGALEPGTNPLSDVSGELFDIRAKIAPGGAAEVGFVIRGVEVRYDAGCEFLFCQGKAAPLDLVGDAIDLQILVDRTSIEIFGNQGEAVLSFCFLPEADNTRLDLFARGGAAEVRSLDVWELKSVWR
ncbi:MAG TPA: glycoside hydrolase family 32 protein [Sumerlaeia bacterium]|nr:glycoside hydrolase family 32 protein [Sumerlaeia bacterium]